VSQVAWTAIPATTAGEDFDTPDIRDVLQEIIGHEDWAAGNALTLFIGDEDHESDQEDDHFRNALRSGVGPRLIVTFSVSADPATYRVALGDVPPGLPKQVAETLHRGEQALVE
jgi:hypothetical protein